MNAIKITQGWRRGVVLAAALVILLVFTITAFAGGAATTVDWFVFGGGGGGASSGSVTLDSTLGQPVTGVSTGSSAALCAGYWCAEQPVQVFLPMLRH